MLCPGEGVCCKLHAVAGGALGVLLTDESCGPACGHMTHDKRLCIGAHAVDGSMCSF